MNCERLDSCPFYNDKMPLECALGSLFKKRYCRGDISKCARFQVATQVGKDHVPANLFPNMQKEADMII